MGLSGRCLKRRTLSGCITGRRLLLRGARVHDQKVGRRLRVYHGDLRTFHGVHQAVGRVHDSATLQPGHRGLDFQRLRPEAGVPRLHATGRRHENTRCLLHM